MADHYRHLSAEDRGAIMVLKQQGDSIRAISRTLGRAPSTISRELKRNGWRSDKPKSGPIMGRPRVHPSPAYDAALAGHRARRLRHLSRRKNKLAKTTELWREVRAMLDKMWSPQQIAHQLKVLHPAQPTMQASHETIYTAIYAMPKGELRKEVITLLRQSRSNRKPYGRAERRGELQEMLSIHVRPPEIEDRLVPGHWEGDLIKGANNKSSVGTLVCRKTKFVMIVKVDGATALDVFRGFEMAFSPLDEALRQTLTYDQGKEMALHKKLAESTGLKIYFCDPHSPWQRGTNENINSLIRQYLPKGTDLSVYSQQELDNIAWSLNTRPRATLNWKTPAEVFFEDCIKHNAAIPKGVALAP
jgi:IS30 family transposase